MGVTTPTSILSTDPPPPANHLKSTRNTLKVDMPQSYGTQAKRLQKERKGRGFKKVPATQESGNIIPGNTTSYLRACSHPIPATILIVLVRMNFPPLVDIRPCVRGSHISTAAMDWL